MGEDADRDMLFGSGFDLTVLQPTAYMQNILGAWRGIIVDGVFRIPYPVETRISLVDLEDVAEAAALVLTQARSRRRNLRAGRHRAVEPERCHRRDQRCAAASCARGGGAGRGMGRRAGAGGMGEYERHTLAAMFRYYADYGLIGNSNALSWLLGRAPHTIAHFIGRVGARGVDG